MGTAPEALQRLSRFQVLTEEEPAWAADERGTLYRFDGFYFSRRRPRDASFSIVPSWQTPPHGWVVVAECSRAELFGSPENGLLVPSLSSPHRAA
jgi:hypothetical protein